MRTKPPHEPTEKDRHAVETMASFGIPELDIARVIGISLMTLRKWYLHELQTGGIKANSMVAQSLYQKALGNGNGAVAACIFWLKVRAGWIEPRPGEEYVGKKEQLQQAARTAGEGTEWADDLKFENRAN
jgi:hypothetical protein